MESHRFRRRFMAFSYLALVLASLLGFGKLRLLWPFGGAVRAVGGAMFLATMVVAARVHSIFPEKHDRAGDFDVLVTWGPYSYCRHPFYLSLIMNQLSIPLLLLSWLGVVVYALLLPGWYALMRMEEKELISYWGEAYVRYMERVPMLIPRLRLRRPGNRDPRK